MTDDHQTCVRGCTRRGELLPTGERAEIPAEARVGLLCQRCADRLQQWITDIPDLYAGLDPDPGIRSALGGTGTGTSHGRRSHSPALARLDVIALQDRRTRFGIDDPDDHAVDVVGEVMSWTAMFTEEQHLTSEITDIGSACTLLTTWHTTLCRQPWIDEMFEAIHGVVKELHRVLRSEQPTFRGHCITMSRGELCGTKIYALANDTVQCRRCRRIYEGVEQIRLADSRDQFGGFT